MDNYPEISVCVDSEGMKIFFFGVGSGARFIVY